MKLIAILAVFALASASKQESSVTPVQKVIQLLNGMAEQGKKEKHEEQVQFAAFKQFCDGTTIKKQKAIKQGNADIEKYMADISKFTADAEQLGYEIGVHDEEIA